MSFWVTGSVGAYNVISGFAQADALKANADAKSGIDAFNAKWAAVDAYNVQEQGIGQSERYQTTIDKTVGQQRTGYASGGVDVNSGTAAMVQAQTKLQGVVNILDIQNQAYAKAKGYQTQALNDTLQSYLDKAQGEVSGEGAILGGIGQGASAGLSGYTASQSPRGTGGATGRIAGGSYLDTSGYV